MNQCILNCAEQCQATTGYTMLHLSTTDRRFVDVLDRAFIMYRRNWKSLWRAMAPTLLSIMLLMLVTRMLFGIDSAWTLLFLLPPWEVWNSLVNIARKPQDALSIEGVGLIIF